MSKGVLIIIISITNFCICFNISALQSSGERISQLLDEEGKKGKNTGYNVAKIKLSNEVILQLVAKGTKKEHGEEILRLISEYTVGMNENSLDIAMLNNIPQMFSVYEDIYNYGKPPFIDYPCDVEGMQARFQWEDGPVHYFKYIRNDALKAWDYFAEQFLALRNKLKPY